MPPTLLSLEGEYSSTCGYCGTEPGTRSTHRSSHSYGVYPLYSKISSSIYLAMIDRGWRSLDALRFSPSRSQRQVTNRWNRFILNGDKKVDQVEAEGSRSSSHAGKISTKAPVFDLVTAIHCSEIQFLTDENPAPAHRFEVVLEPSNFTQEKFKLYQIYQRDIHKEQEEKTVGGFRNFLVDSPLLAEPIPYPTPPPSHLPEHYGSYHQCYRIDGELCAVAVLDILPGSVSSVYFMYDSRWERFSLGKISVLREAALAREINNSGISSMNYLNLGFYVHSCPKMRYKGGYMPSYLLDPEEYTWFPFKQCTPLLDKYRYACFSHPQHSLGQECEFNKVLDDIPSEILDKINILESFDVSALTANITSVARSSSWQVPSTREDILCGIRLLGPDVAQKVILVVDK